ncbi:MAG: leucine-rich repeat domain-containing protein, partial [Promethearchaeota archaeon]
MTEEKTLRPEEIKLLEDIGIQSRYKTPILPHDGKPTSQSFFYKVENGDVVELNLRNSGFETLPENIDELKSLKTLNLSDNPLTMIPDSIGNLKSLEVLNLDHTNLTTLPESIRNLTSLQKLNLDSNKLMTK